MENPFTNSDVQTGSKNAMQSDFPINFVDVALTQSVDIGKSDASKGAGANTDNANNNEGSLAKLGREAIVFGEGIKDGIVDGAREACADKAGTALRIGSALATGALLTTVNGRAGLIGMAGRALQTGFAVSFIADVAAPARLSAIGNAWSDTWKSGDNNQENIDIARQQLGRFAFDNVLLTAAGLAGAKGAGHLSEKFPGALTHLGTGIKENLAKGFDLNNAFGLRADALAPAYSSFTPAKLTAFSESQPQISMMSVRDTGSRSYHDYGAAGGGGASGSSSGRFSLREFVEKNNRYDSAFNHAADLPSFSASTRKILAGGDRPIFERIYGKEYSSSGLPSQGDYHPDGFKPIVPYEKAAEILNPAAFQPKVMTSLRDMGDSLQAQRRVELGQSDALAQQLRQNVVDNLAKGKELAEKGQRLQQHLEDQIAVHDSSFTEDLKFDLNAVIEKERHLNAIEDEAKQINVLRLESARIQVKLNKMTRAENEEGVTPDKRLTEHLLLQKAVLQEEIETRSPRVGKSERLGKWDEPSSPIDKAKAEVREATNQVIGWFDFSSNLDRSQMDPFAHYIDSDKYEVPAYRRSMDLRGPNANFAVDMIDTQRFITNNLRDQAEHSVQFSESVYAYQARLHELQNPRQKTDLELLRESNAEWAAKSAQRGGERITSTDELERSAPAETPDFDGRVEAAAFVENGLRDTLRQRAISSLSTESLQKPGLLDQTASKMYQHSAVAFFQYDTAVRFPSATGESQVAIVNVANYKEAAAKLGDFRADGYAVISPVVQPDGSPVVLREQPISGGRGTRPVYQKEVSVVGGNVPSNVTEGTSFGKLFSMFRSGEI